VLLSCRYRDLIPVGFAGINEECIFVGDR
jgi:hypothetical protein